MTTHGRRWLCGLLALATILGACATAPRRSEAPPAAITGSAGTTLATIFPQPPDSPDRSGVLVLDVPTDALVARMALAETADRTLDLQYYEWAGDPVGHLFAARVLRAADRGVKVRVLLDDISLGGRDKAIAALDTHPNIEIRVFNPFLGRRLSALVRPVEFLIRGKGLNHRMHNKAFIADNHAAVVGGRNIAAGYFGLGTEHNYRDLDALVAGPAVRAVSVAFDQYWNSEWAVPIRELLRGPGGRHDVAWVRSQLAASEPVAWLSRLVPGRAEALTGLQAVRAHLEWAPAIVVADAPRKVHDPTVLRVTEKLLQITGGAEREMVIESPYLVLRARGIDLLAAARQRGVRIRVLTNSLASTDVVPVHSGYAPQRKQLIAAGLEIYELQPDAALHPGTDENPREVPTTLHAKSGTVDDVAFIGSANLDQRSSRLNTEMIMIVQSAAVARRVAAFVEDGMRGRNAWLVARGGRSLAWLGEARGDVLEHRGGEPDASAGRRVKARLFSLLPIEGLL